MEVDLSQFENITDRVARAKAKAEAIRKAKQSGAEPAGPGSASPEAPAAGVQDEQTADQAGKQGLELIAFMPGNHFKLKGRAGRVVGTRYDLVTYIFDDDPDGVITTDRFRLSHACAQGDLVFAPRSEAYRSESFTRHARVDYHDYVWLDTRKGMTAKKRRPKILAIINPDYCTGCNACIEVCPTDCIEEVPVAAAGLDGIGTFCEVRLDDCIGCKQCVSMCPWEAIDMFDTDRVEEAYSLPAGTL